MTKQQLLALLREAYLEGKREQCDVDLFINDVVMSNKVGDLDLPELLEWVDCNERLPDESRDYTVYNPTSVYSKVYTATWHGNKWNNSNGFITHWMPLPPQPNKD